jgi:hypothetical protein
MPRIEEPRHITEAWQAGKESMAKPNGRLVISMPPRHGKSGIAAMLIHDARTDWRRGIPFNENDPNAFYGRSVAYVTYSEPMAHHQVRRMTHGPQLAMGILDYDMPRPPRTFDVVVFDDLYKNRAEAEDSERGAYRMARVGQFLECLNPGGNAIMLGSRWSKRDVMGRLPGEWTRLDMPAVSETGEALWPEKFPVSELMSIKAAIGDASFAALFQQAPLV